MKDIFIIPEQGTNIVYAPLLGILFDANDVFCDELRQYLRTGTTSDSFHDELESIGLLSEPDPPVLDVQRKVTDALSPTSLIFLFSESCNLRCKYCFASAGNKPTPEFNEELAHAAVSFVIDNARAKDVPCTVSFHGGGEPTYHFQWLTRIVTYAKEYAAQRGMADKVNFVIVTNGFMSAQRATWLSDNMTRVQVSLDGYAETQNDQRPAADGSDTFDRVFQTVKILEKGKADLLIRTTVSRKIQSKLAEIAKFFCENIDINQYYFGTVNNYGRASHSEYCEPDSGAYILNLLEAQKVANQYGKRIIACSAQDNFPDITYEYCGVTVPIFGVTREGNITACPEVISADDRRREIFWYGSFDEQNGQFLFDEDKIQSLVSYQAKDTAKCAGCFAKYQCAGDCRARWYDYDTGEQILGEDFRCVVNRSLVEKKLEDAVLELV